MAASFPGALPAAVTATPSTTLANAGHATALHQKDRDEIIALGTKVGLGSASGTPGSGVVLVGTGAGTSAWQPITAAFLATGSATGAVTSDVIRNGAVLAAALATGSATGAVTTDAIRDSAVTAAKIASTTITSGKIASDAIVTSLIAANAVTQYATASGSASGTTTSTSYVDMSNMSVTLTTTGGPILVWASMVLGNLTGGTTTFVALSLDGASETFPQDLNLTGASNMNVAIVGWYAPAAGSRTVKIRWRVAAGTGVIYGTQRYMLMVELKK